jgi:hypothetical protein
MQATYSLQRSSVGVLTAAIVFLAALILGGAGGYVLKSATGVSVASVTSRANPAAISAPANITWNTDASAAQARKQFQRAN